MKSIIIVENSERKRNSLQSILHKHHVRILGSAADGYQAMLLMEQLQPDMVLMNTTLPAISGAEVLELLNKRHYPGKIVFITSQPEMVAVQDYLQRGAAAMIGERNLAVDLPRALDAVNDGYAFFPQYHFFDATVATHNSQPNNVMHGLSLQENRVLHYLLKGFNNNEIASMMALSNKTVSTYKIRVLQKNQAKNMVELLMKFNSATENVTL
ncbi:response regulator [Pantoea sp.]|uniref:response regulator n=1 Tax=Pantoea sp. TaxID=69393 RepID=UPI0031D9102A